MLHDRHTLIIALPYVLNERAAPPASRGLPEVLKSFVTKSRNSPSNSAIIILFQTGNQRLIQYIVGGMAMLFKQKNACQSLSMGSAAQELKKDGQIRLVDVRTEEEYREGHIPGSVNLPLNRITDIPRLVPDKDARVFVYCLSGGRSQVACAQLIRLGYTNVTNIGGISQWPGAVQKGVSA